MKELPKINQLKNLRAIIQHGSISSASQSLFQTQSTMTRSIQELERILGISLLVRGNNGVVLTELGRIFEPRMNSVLNELERAIDELRQIEHASHGTIVFGCSHLPAFSIIPKVISNFQESYDSARITIFEGQFSEILASLRLNKLDFYIGVIPINVALNDFIEEHLSTTKSVVISRKGHPLSKCTSLSELQGAKWYLPTANAGYYCNIERTIFKNNKNDYPTVIFGDSATIAEQLILNEDYLSVSTISMFLLPKIKNLVSIISVKDPLPDGRYSLIYSRTQKPTPVASILMDELRHAYYELIREHSSPMT